MEKRITEASALRELFREQWIQLMQRIRHMEQQRNRQKRQQKRLDQAVEVIVDGTDRRMRAVTRYQKRLRHSTRCLLNYIGEIINSLPPAIPFNPQSLHSDPLLNAIFTSPREAYELFASSPAISDYFRAPAAKSNDVIYCLVMFRTEEKTRPGMALHNDQLLRDVMQTCVLFHGHRLVATAGSEPELRATFKMLLFESVVAYLRDYMTRLRHDRLSQEERSRLPDEGAGIEDPARYMEVLEWLLSLPQTLIRIQSNILRINRMRIKLPEDADEAANELLLSELAIGDEPVRQFIIIEYPREQWLTQQAGS